MGSCRSRDLCFIQPTLCALEDCVSCGSRKDRTVNTVLELCGKDCYIVTAGDHNMLMML